jgi:hypothetical protein
MGVTFSSEPNNKSAEDLANISTISDGYSTLLSFKQCLRVRMEIAAKLVSSYITHVFSPIIDEVSLKSMVYTALKPRDSRVDNTKEIDEICRAAWRIFSDPVTEIMNTQEFLAVIVLLADAPWENRLFLLFELFKNLGTDNMMHADIQLVAHVSAAGLFKLWQVKSWDHDEFKTMTEGIADNAYLKMNKEMEESCQWSHFSVWAKDRFRDSRTVATQAALKSVYESAYA